MLHLKYMVKILHISRTKVNFLSELLAPSFSVNEKNICEITL